MSHQQLNGAQVRTGLEQMGGEAVPERVRTHPLLDTCACGGGLANVPHGLVRDRSLDGAHLAWEQIAAWLLPAPVVAQRLQQLGGERNIAIAQALTSLDVNDHALAVDVADLQA